MKRLTMLVAIATVGCTVTIKPIPSKNPAVRHHSTRKQYSGSAIQTHTSISKPDQNVKETWWIENYHKLEAAHGDYTIRGDDQIEPLPDGKFRVPDSVLAHYQDLLLVTPTPKP